VPAHPGLADDVIVTGEAVALEVRPASLLSRVLAILLDLVVYGAVAVGALVLVSMLPAADDAAVAAAVIAAVALVMVGLPTGVETLTRGRSLGKLAAGIAIVRDDGGPVRFRHALVRSLVGIGELWMTWGAVAIVCSILHPKGKRVGDIAAGTYCVRLRGGGPRTAPLVMPPELAAWAAGADIRALPDGLALQARRFVGRAASLHPAARDSLGRSLAGAVEPLVAPPPPWGTPPERFLAAVLAARRDRELALAAAARARSEARVREVRRLPFRLGAGPGPHS
jgi:uncharacterized RDD family membrane protein YckC